MGLFLEAIVQGILQILIWLIIASAIMSWLIAFNVINDRHPIVRQIERVLWAITRPILRPVQKIIPPLGGTVDISPIIVILVLGAAQTYLVPWIFAPIIVALGG